MSKPGFALWCVAMGFIGVLLITDQRPILMVLGIVPIIVSVLAGYFIALHLMARSKDESGSGAASVSEGTVHDLLFGHRQTLAKVSAVWVGSGLVLAYSAYILGLGLGADWLPIFREINIGKQHPLYGYAMLDGPFFISGFLFVSGFAWLPMYYFFEGMDVKRKIAAISREVRQDA
jgi:hypothetical protein